MLNIQFSIILILFGLFGQSTLLAQEALDEVILQLKWKHQYQFAGYYAAQKMGYYREAGLKVTIKEAEFDADPLMSVELGNADFAVGSSDILLLKERGFEPVVLANIFQHSAVGFLSLEKSNIKNIHDLATRKIMIEDGSTELYAYLNQEGVNLENLNLVKHEFTNDKLISGAVDAITIYITNEPYFFETEKMPFRVFTPLMGGLDFYGDNLFTNQNQLDSHPERVDAFIEASLRGWRYAMANKEETVDLMLTEFNVPKTREHLLYEANAMDDLIMQDVVSIGYTSLDRWQRTQDYFASLGMLTAKTDLSDFIYNPNPFGKELEALKEKTFFLISGILLATIISVLMAGFIIRFRKEIRLRKQAELSISQALDEAEEANKTKSAFIATVSHEIRTPLTAILGTTQLLEETKTNKEQKNLIGHLGRSGQYLLKLLNDILDFSKNENEQIHTNIIAFDPTELLDDIFKMMQNKATGKELELIKNIDPLPPLLMGDPFLIRQVLTNFIDNAIKFTITGNVTLDVFYLDKNEEGDVPPLCFSVKDTGIGIATENQETIFEAFRQEETGISRRYGGNGLGLSICTQLVERMDGEIILESTKAEGSNFSFILTLPETKTSLAKTKAPLVNSASQLNILLVDDFESNRITISKLLESSGHKVETASSGEETISKVIHNKYDLILMDIHMPDIDGIETTKRLKALFLNNKNMPHIFAFTADISAHAKKVYAEAGMKEIVTKPFNKTEFNQVLVRYFDQGIIIKNHMKINESIQNSEYLDLKILEEYKEILSENEFSEMITSYHKNTEKTLGLMKQSFEDDEEKSFNDYTHRLKGASGVVGFKAVLNWCENLYEKSQNNDIKNLSPELIQGEELLRKSLLEANNLYSKHLN